MGEDILLVFRSVHDVMHAESVLRRAGTPCRLEPMPASVRSDCGMIVVAPGAQPDALVRLLVEGGAYPEALYRRRGPGEIEPLPGPDAVP
jgi:hypothetical protein